MREVRRQVAARGDWACAASWCIACGVALVCISASAQQQARRSSRQRGEVTVEAAISAAELDALAGRPCEFVLATGKRVSGTTLLRIVRGKDKQTVRTVVYRKGDSKATRKYRPNALKRVIVKGKPYGVAADLSLRAFVLVDVAVKQRLVGERLEAKGNYETAKKTRSFASRVFRYAVATGRAKNDPAQLLQGALVSPKARHYACVRLRVIA